MCDSNMFIIVFSETQQRAVVFNKSAWNYKQYSIKNKGGHPYSLELCSIPRIQWSEEEEIEVLTTWHARFRYSLTASVQVIYSFYTPNFKFQNEI